MQSLDQSLSAHNLIHNFMQRFGLIGPVLHCSGRHWIGLISNEYHLSCLVPECPALFSTSRKTYLS